MRLDPFVTSSLKGRAKKDRFLEIEDRFGNICEKVRVGLKSDFLSPHLNKKVTDLC